MYILYALLGAVMASVGTIFAKVGLKGVDPNLLTALRGIVMAIVVTLAALSFGRLTQAGFLSLTTKNWMFIILSGLAGALSWIFFYHALSTGPVLTVTVIDKLSLLFTAVLALIVLAEGITLSAGIGLILVITGTILVAIPWTTLTSLFK
jgi:transporter family protein